MPKKTTLAIIILLLSAISASASYITLNTSVTSKVEKNTLQIDIETSNKGDESAHNVQAEVRVGDTKLFGTKKSELKVNETYKIDLSEELKLKEPGQYPLIILIHYTDANQYPFSSLIAQTFVHQSQSIPSDLFGKLESTCFWKQGKIKLTLKNSSQENIQTNTYLATPKELSVKEGKIDLLIPAKGKNSLDFNLENFSALSNSTYPVFAVSEYTKDGRRQTSISAGTVRIKETKTIWGFNYAYLAMLLGILLLIFIFFQIRKK